MTILLSRTDSIGDVVLSLPLAALLKEHMPSAKIIMLTSSYAAPVAWYCEYVDEVWSWQELLLLSDAHRVDRLREASVDVVIHVFPHPDIARWAHEAEVPVRIGTTHRTFHWLTCTKHIWLSRKNSALHEAQLNARLLTPLIGKHAWSLDELSLRFGMKRWVQPLSDKLRSYLHPAKFNLILHPKSQGSAPQWDTEAYQRLIELLPSERFRIIITGTEQEATIMRELLDFVAERGARRAVHFDEEGNAYEAPAKPEHAGLARFDVIDATGATTLDELITLIAYADGIVAASTGPLHIATALDKHALGLYVPRRPMHPARWKPLGKHADVLTGTNECTGKCLGGTDCACMGMIHPEHVASRILQWKPLPSDE
jgi:ADP-heptose:LPS heptosyltransferase